MDVKSNHTPQPITSKLSLVKQDIMTRVSEQVGNIHSDPQIPSAMKNISLYLEAEEGNVFFDTEFGGIKRASRYNLVIKEYVKYSDLNWVVFIELFNIPDITDNYVTDLNLENPFAAIKKLAVGCSDGQILLAPKGAERVIHLSNDFEMNKVKIILSELRAFMSTLPLNNGYKIDRFEEGVYLLDSPAPLFANDTVMYRDSDFVGMWLSFGTLLRYELDNLNVFNIDGTPVGVIDPSIDTSEAKVVKLLSNMAYSHASIIIDKEKLLKSLMEYSKQYVYETNMQDETRICIDNLLVNLQDKGIFGLLYEDMDIIENFPLIAYNPATVSCTEHLGTTLLFKYKNEYIYMILEEDSMHFLSYAGKITNYGSSKYGYSVKIMNDMWLSKTSFISQENFILFTGFPNLQHNKVIDIYFDNAIESFSDIDKEFAIDVTEFDEFYAESIAVPNTSDHVENVDLLHSYGNNPFALVTGLMTYEFDKFIDMTPWFKLSTNAEPMISSIIDPINKRAYLMVPSIKTNSAHTTSVSELRIGQFITNYVARYLNSPEDLDKWVEEAEYGGFVYNAVFAYFSNGWTILKDSENKYVCLHLNPIRLLYKFSGAVEHLALAEAVVIVDLIASMRDSGSSAGDIEDMYMDQIQSRTSKVTARIQTGLQAIHSTFVQEAIKKSSYIVNVLDANSPRFEFNRFKDADNIFINNTPTGPAQNHAFLYEDTFVNIFQKFKDEYLSSLDIDVLPVSIYCPYLNSFHTVYTEKAIKINVESDVSNSIEVLKNDTLGISVLGDILSSDGTITIGESIFTVEEAYDKHIDIQFFGIKNILQRDMTLFKITEYTTMSEAVKEAYLAEFTAFNDKICGEMGVDFDTEFQSVLANNNLSSKSLELASPIVPGGQPLYVAVLGVKMMTSLNAESFIDAPLGDKGVSLSARITIEDKTRFLGNLQNMVNTDLNKISYTLYSSEAHSKSDIYNIAIKNVWIPTGSMTTDGYTDVTILFKVDSGQIVVSSDIDTIYNTGDTFAVTKRIDVDGFISEDQERIRILVNFSIDYYVVIPADNDTVFGTAMELMEQEGAYLATLGLPISIGMDRGDYAYVDDGEATTGGLSGWFDFTKEI